MRLLTRIRVSAGHLILVAVLTMVAGVLMLGAPRVTNQLEDEALRARIESLPYQVKDVAFHIEPFVSTGQGLGPQHAAARLEQQRSALPLAFANRIKHSWYSVHTPLTPAQETGLPTLASFGLRGGTGIQEGSRLVEGRWPDNSAQLPRLEVALTETSAKLLNQSVGSDFVLEPGVEVRVVGLVAPANPADPVWDREPYALKAYVPQADGEQYLAYYLTDIPGLRQAAVLGMLVGYEWRYRLDLSKLDSSVLPGVVAAVLDAQQLGIGDATAETGLDTALTRFADNAKAAQAIFAVVQAATLATLAGLLILATRLAVVRRRAELELMRARGATLRRIGWHLLAEALPIVPLAALAGWFLSQLAPGRPAQTTPLLVAFALLGLAASPVLAIWSFNRKRATLLWEIGLVVLAGLGVWLLRRRGLGELDLYLVLVPVLLAAAAAVITLRILPVLTRLASRIAARGRGTVGFLGFARAGRSATTIGPIAVLVVAVCTAVFSVGIAGTVAHGRNRAAGHDVPADAIVTGFRFATDTAAQLEALPGISGVAEFAQLPAMNILSGHEAGAENLAQVYVFVVDGAAMARLAGDRAEIPGAIARAQRSEAAPALVSPELAAALAGNPRPVVDLQGRNYDFEVAGVVDAFPVVPRTATHFIVLPWQGLNIRDDKPLIPTGFLLTGEVDAAMLVGLGNQAQMRWGIKEPSTAVKTWQQRRAELDRIGVNSVLTFSYGIGGLAGVVLALLSVGFAVLSGARSRGKVLSRLRTMGLDMRQGRALLLVELAPVVAGSVLAGSSVGLGLPLLIGPVLNLTSFTDGFDAGLYLDPWVIGGSLGLVLAGLATALIVETWFNRRLRLGEVLRLGSSEQE